MVMPKIVLLWTDVAIWLLVIALLAYGWVVARSPNLAANWSKVFRSAPALASSVVLALCMLVTLADSLHYRPVLPAAAGTQAGTVAYDTRVKSLLDALLAEVVESREATYSEPLAYVGFTKESLEVNGKVERVAPRLQFGGAHLKNPESDWLPDVASRAVVGALLGLAVALLAGAALVAAVARSHPIGFGATRPASLGAWPA
jgi:peptide/nickel transport system permease protein